MDEVCILVVEDNADISNMPEDLLAQYGWETVPACSGTEALLPGKSGRVGLEDDQLRLVVELPAARTGGVA